MATIVTSTQVQGFSYPSASYMDLSPVTGNLAVIVRLTSGELRVYSSVNNGTSWVDTTAGFNRSNLQEWSGIFIDTDGFLHIGYRVYESGQDKIYYRRAGLNDSNVLVWDSEVLVASASAGVSGAVYQGVDVIGMNIGGDYYIHLAVGTTSGANVGVTMFSIKITYEYSWFFFPYWSYTVKNSLISGTRSWFVTGSGRVTPALDFRHNGDAHTGDIPDLWVAFGRAQTCIARMSYGSGKWTGTATAVALATPTTAMDANPGRFDGTRFLVPSLNGAKVDVYERDLANVTTQLRQSPTHTTGVVRYVAIDYAPQSGDFRVFAVGTSTNVLYYVDYVRATNTWGAWISTGLTVINANNFGTRRGAYRNARYDYYTQTGTSPYTLSGTHSILVFPPNTPIWVTPTTGTAQDIGKVLTLSWQFSDPNPSDTQSAYALNRQIGAGTVQYWNAASGTWVASEVQNSSVSTTVTLPAAWGVDADATHLYKIKTWDSTGLPSSYSTGLSIIPSSPITPTLISPFFSATTILNDKFNRVAAEIISTTPDLAAGVWVGNTGGWTLDGSKAVYTGAEGTFNSTLDVSSNQLNKELRIDNLYISTLSSTSSVRYILNRPILATSGEYIAAYIYISPAGVPQINFIKVINGVTTDGWGGSPIISSVIPSNTALNGPYTFTVSVVENVVTAKINNFAVSRYLTNAELAILKGLTTLTRMNIAASSSISGNPDLEVSMDEVTGSTLSIATVNGPYTTIQWSSTGQAAFKIDISDVSGGSSVLVHSSGWVGSVAQSYAVPMRLIDLTTYNVSLSIRNSEGLVGPVVDRVFYVDYTEPVTPTYTVSPNSNLGYTQLSVTNTKPTGTQPALIQNDVYRRVVGDTGFGTKIATIQPSYLPVNALKWDGIDRESIENTSIGYGTNDITISTLARSNLFALDGTWSLEETSVNGSWSGALVTPHPNIPVSALTEYKLSWWMRAATVGRNWRAIIQFYNSVPTTLGSLGGIPSIADVVGSWTQWSVTFTTLANTTLLGITIAYPGTGNSGVPIGEKHYFDRIELIKTTDLPAPVTYNDFTARHGVDYEYRIQAIGTNGAAQYGAWVS